jgi:hypothetical protein
MPTSGGTWSWARRPGLLPPRPDGGRVGASPNRPPPRLRDVPARERVLVGGQVLAPVEPAGASQYKGGVRIAADGDADGNRAPAY